VREPRSIGERDEEFKRVMDRAETMNDLVRMSLDPRWETFAPRIFLGGREKNLDTIL
jgi:hypothetical protein